jgi:NDP-sugar pyrophosphorylase family protein
MNLEIESLLNLEETSAGDIFKGLTYPWEALAIIKSFLLSLSKSLPTDFEQIEEFVWVGKGTVIDNNVTLNGPAIIGYNCQIRHSAYIREHVVIGNEVVVGNSTEVKNSILFNNVQVPHFNYVGDSILGHKAHLGAGVKLSNVKSTGDLVKVKTDTEIIDTGLLKLGAILGDHAEVGCNAVLNPGTIVGRESIIYPLVSARGIIPERYILKGNGELVKRRF